MRDPCNVGAQVYHCAALIEVKTSAHCRVCIPEVLFVASIKNILPKGALCSLIVGVGGAVEGSKLTHGHINKFTLLFQLAVVFHSIVIGLGKKFIGGFPSAHFVEPTGANEHHIVGIAVVVLGKVLVLVNKVIKIRIFNHTIIIVVNHTSQHVLRVCAKVGAVAVKTRHKVTGQVRYCHNSAVVVFARCRTMGVDL